MEIVSNEYRIKSVLGRLEMIIDNENTRIGSDPQFDLKVSNAHKSRCLYELSMLFRDTDPAELAAAHLDQLHGLKKKLVLTPGASRRISKRFVPWPTSSRMPFRTRTPTAPIPRNNSPRVETDDQARPHRYLGLRHHLGLGLFFGVSGDGAGAAAIDSKQGALELVKGETITVPVIGDGAITGYFLGRISFMMNKEMLKGVTLPLTEMTTDQLFSLLVGNKMVDLAHIKSFDPKAFRDEIKKGMNERLGGEYVADVMLEQLDYLSKEEVKENSAGQPKKLGAPVKIIEGAPPREHRPRPPIETTDYLCTNGAFGRRLSLGRIWLINHLYEHRNSRNFPKSCLKPSCYISWHSLACAVFRDRGDAVQPLRDRSFRDLRVRKYGLVFRDLGRMTHPRQEVGMNLIANFAVLASRRTIFDLPVCDLGWDDALVFINELASIPVGQTVVCFVNAHNMLTALRDDDYYRIMSRNLVLPDGIGLNIASQIAHGAPFPANLNGTDFVPAFLTFMEAPRRIGLIGGTRSVVEAAAENFRKHTPWHEFIVISDGFFDKVDSTDVVEEIERQKPDILIVGMGTPLQEKWVHDKIRADHARLVLTVGALFDFVSGAVPRRRRPCG